MRILHFFLFAILLKNVYCHSSNPLPKPNASPFQVPATNTKLAKVRPQAPARPPPPPPQVTSYILALTWPPGACTKNSGINCQISPVPTEFKIHGLWPQPNGPPSNETFGNQIANITTDLKNSWPNLRSKTQQAGENSKFWEHEWTKHGKYSDLGVLEYFKKTLALFNMAGEGLTGKLAAENIKPTLFRNYTVGAIEAALMKIYCGFSCTVICNQRNPNEKQIQEIRLMYTKYFKLQDNRVTSSTCGTTNVIFPALR